MSKEDFYEVDEILDYKCIKHRKYYLIKWKGYSSVDNTWEPLSNLSNVQQMVIDFDKQHKKKVKKEQLFRPTNRKGRPSKMSILQKIMAFKESVKQQQEEDNDQQKMNVEKESKIITPDPDDVSEGKQSSISQPQLSQIEFQQQEDLQQLENNKKQMNYQKLFDQVTNQIPEEIYNNQKMKLLRNQVPVDYLIHYYLSTQINQNENHQMDSEDSSHPTENYLQKPVVQALLKQIIQFTDHDANEIAQNQSEKLHSTFFGF